jgi:hypothetical protein
MANFTKNYETTEIIENPNVLGGGAKPLDFGKISLIHSPTFDNKPIVKELKSKEQVNKEIDERIAKIQFPYKTTLMTSAVPLGLAYYSYYNNYSLTKGIGVVVIGSVVAIYGTMILTVATGKGKFV